MSDIILHHYPQSPVSEKVRSGLGIKQATWQSVEIPRLPPKPDLMPLTGGHRRTPVMQIGADIFCDSECILHTIDQRIPTPPFYGTGSLPWEPGSLFDLIFRLVLVFTGDAMPEGFVEDRGRLYLGPDWDMADVSAEIPNVIEEIKARFAALDSVLATNGGFLNGETAGAPDANAYHLVWFLRGRWEGGSALLDALPTLCKWEQRMLTIGHGTWSEISSQEALDIASRSEPVTQSSVGGTTEWRAGQDVAIAPDGDGGDPEVSGALHFMDDHTMAVMRTDDRAGQVCVHFPRAGYRIRAL